MTELLKWIYYNAYGNLFYYSFHVLGFICVFLFSIWYGKKLKYPWWKSILIVLIVYPVIYFWMYVMFWIETAFSKFGGNNIVRVFIYVPLAGWPVAKLLKIEWKSICNFLAFSPLVVHGVSHFGCIFVGCCMGYPSSWGIYNPRMRTILFPVQIFEALTAILIILYLLLRSKKRNYEPDEFAFPIMLILFGSTRFIWEFFRDNEKIWLGCSALAFHAFFMMLVGIVAYIIIKRKQALKLNPKTN